MSERSLFLTLLAIPDPVERAAYLDRECCGNPALRSEVESLLRAHEEAGSFMGRPAGVLTARVDPVPATEQPGRMIGPYKVMEQIGEGGMGRVFVAEQQTPVRRKVALKVIRPAMGAHDVVARFEAERQALALMDHPHIAKVLDAGETESGYPYFVMELVRGIPLTEFCDRNRLSLRERLELFIDACQAIQHAHQKGVIHRDLKPTNLLVTLHDGRPVVKVIDFGVAKAISQPLTDKTIYSRFAQMIGTPLYMSPEQAELSGLDVDTRSDIYSLGVLLYELLTGTTPLAEERIKTVGFDEIRRIIREEEIPQPSARLSTLGEALAGVSMKRRTEPRTLSSLMRGDLDWIVGKALEKDRTRRYETAAALAADVRRFLNEEPVEARPPSAWYRFRKVARRNKVALTTVALVVVALLMGAAGSIWQAVRARAAEKAAVAAQRKSENFAARLTGVNLLLDSARAYAENGGWAAAYGEYCRAADLLPEHYMVWSGRGGLYAKLGLWKLAAADYAKALELGAAPKGPAWWGLPQLLLYAGDERRYREACGGMLEQLGDDSDASVVLNVIRCCSLSPEPVGNPAELAARAEKLLSERERQSVGAAGRKMRLPVRYFCQTAGHIEYRAGRYELAVEHLRQAVGAEARDSARATVYPMLAMACHRAGRREDAQAALVVAEANMNQWIEQMVGGLVGTMPIFWFDWVECSLLLDEASMLITGQRRAVDPRLAVLEQRALEAIRQP